jgi:predicted aconitase with swiveling domain
MAFVVLDTQNAGYGASGIVPETAVMCTGAILAGLPVVVRPLAAELVSQIETSKERKLGPRVNIYA